MPPRTPKPGKPKPSSLWDFQRGRHQGITPLEERDRDDRYNKAMAEEVSRWVIQGYVTLTFTVPRSGESGKRAARAWLRSLRSLGPHRDLFALLVPERGAAGNVVHIEVALGGLLSRHIPVSHRVCELNWILHKAAQCWVGDPAGFSTPEARLAAIERTKNHGRITVEKPKSRRDVALYVTKQCHHGDWEIIGRPLRRRKRKRKQKPKRGDDGRQRSK